MKCHSLGFRVTHLKEFQKKNAIKEIFKSNTEDPGSSQETRKYFPRKKNPIRFFFKFNDPLKILKKNERVREKISKSD